MVVLGARGALGRFTPEFGGDVVWRGLQGLSAAEWIVGEFSRFPHGWEVAGAPSVWVVSEQACCCFQKPRPLPHPT